MKCPYPDCRKDYNDELWPKAMDRWLNPSGFGASISERKLHNRLFITTRECKFCHRYFHDVFIGHENFDTDYNETESTKSLLVTYPISKTKFDSKNIPDGIIENFNEAEQCRAVGSLTGAGACLRKTIYSVCDDKDVEGRDYREKIGNLDVKDIYKELLKQIKWLGDNTTKPGEEKYDMAMIDVAIEILPILIDALYAKDERVDEATKLLAKARSVNKEK